MEALHHWHPVLLAKELGKRPSAVTVLGRRLAIFRTDGGGLGALADECPHRRMPLSEGRVCGDRLVCPYHGWSFGVRGDGVSPGSPGPCTAVERFDVAERHGAIWVKAHGRAAEIPAIGGPGYAPIGTIRTRFHAPLELVADNLAEMEHTGETHLFFGYDTDSMASVDVRTEATNDEVRVVAVGPQRRLPRVLDWLKRATGSSTDDLFVDEATFRFSPVHSTADSYWIDARTRARRPQGLRGTVFLVPVSERETDVIGFFFFHPGSPKAGLLLRPLVAAVLEHELELDRRMTEKVASRPATLEGMHLGRFDEPVRAIRERIARSYWQAARAAAPDMAAPRGAST